MALQTPYPIVQGSRFLLGPDKQAETILIVPGTSDYTTLGYVITAFYARLKMVQAAIVTGGNTTVYPNTPASTGYYAVPVFPMTQLGTTASPGYGFTGYSQFLLKVYHAGGANIGVEVVNGYNLTGASWQVLVIGY